ncbi:hypothetical protein M436DRAFT_63545 [Aureobasidium namibiae CBS 147.97]|uniref:Uncharacterized protein n=1 Tax=Aureobasidium namibiae CBS 147.97 TaxID=1043004 RepID=A0A074WJB4_9PEZI|nr:uncharacterized protein M436DRAFT_63545 [Aureobasidium namibiae CBS 147.97]KEQ73225.1 hypothetical protein M436DRAFT_63545 [Aureobasidium namibiae CBS 147.97]
MSVDFGELQRDSPVQRCLDVEPAKRGNGIGLKTGTCAQKQFNHFGMYALASDVKSRIAILGIIDVVFSICGKALSNQTVNDNDKFSFPQSMQRSGGRQALLLGRVDALTRA